MVVGIVNLPLSFPKPSCLSPGTANPPLRWSVQQRGIGGMEKK